LLVIVFDFKKLVDLSVLTVAVQYLATSASVPVLRRRGRTGRFRLPAGPLIPVVAFGVVLAMMVTQLVQRGEGSIAIAGTFGVMLLVGIVPAAIYRAVTRHDKRAD
ncbi:MAG: hypothetical protein KC503_05290, partial [Myxococcales bacterium]|nr:hypothetical protein [Myxococcales bacterium]